MTIRELRSGDSQDTAMTRGEYYELRDSEPRPWPDRPVGLLLAAIAAPDDAWRERAACHPDNRDRPVDEWTAIFYQTEGGTYKNAKAICAACPVRDECRTDGRDEVFGMWGGDTAEDRDVARNPDRPPMTRHGYPFGAQAHRRRGEKPCEACMDVQRRYENERRRKVA